MSHSMDKSVNLTRVAEIMRSKGVHTAYVEHTGHGVATLYAGDLSRDAEGEDRYQLAAGPGWFELYGEAFIGFSDFSYGPDNDGASKPLFIREGTEDEIAEIFVSFVKSKG
jgi:hypothetical protein